jgi:hypothetical protein
MKQSLGVIATLFLVALAHPVHADTFAITLIEFSGETIEGTGSFTHAPSDSGTFSNFTVTWDSLLFDFTSIANATGSEMHGCDANLSISVFTYLTNADCNSGNGPQFKSWLAFEEFGNGQFIFSPLLHGLASTTFGIPLKQGAQSGNFTVHDTSLSTPEPNSVILISIALFAVAFVVRKRNARGRSPATQTIR